MQGLQHELPPYLVGVAAFFDELVQQRRGGGGEVGELESKGSPAHLDCIQHFLLVDSRLRLLLQTRGISHKAAESAKRRHTYSTSTSFSRW